MNLMQNPWWKIRLFAPADEGNPGGGDDTAPAGGDDTVSTGDDTISTEADYSFLPEQFRPEGKADIDGFKAHYDELASFHARRGEELAEVPEDGKGYEFAIPDNIDYGDLDLPEDFNPKLLLDDPAMAPLFEEFGGLLHKHNIPKGAAGEFIGLLAKYEAASFSPLFVKSKEEFASLGTAAQSRVDAVTRALEARLPAELVPGLTVAINTAAGVKALEKLLNPRALKTSDPVPKSGDPTKADLDNYYANPTK
ncbi:hypothetical protein GCM10011360_17520 [Primorskyibacter flagellatus]|uniref:Uncharacterized protein n=1 Tax=Primorskyibacter flagellatus TaxID=1387277 RepID=A0A917EEQ2_9RHOB|nr:hypothetical protein [Primorskyibacter flagellatus]GGE29948.1 hypothetical protein GCM10011360_17520 [Primorskyibacter flagellatus]